MLHALGHRFVAVFARLIVCYYFLFSPRAVRSSMRFYAALEPGLSRAGRLARAWRQFQSFSTVFVDRLLAASGQEDRFRFVHDGLDHITAAVAARRPLVLWMSHLGNWEVACHALKGYRVPLTLVLGKRPGERVEAVQKEDLARRGIKAVYVSDDKDLGVLEVAKALKAGEVVAVSGDRLFDASQRATDVTFLGRACRVPVGPYVLSILGDADIVPIFGMREGRLSYRFIALEPRRVRALERAKREAAMREAAARCFADLEAMVKRYPEQWYNFFDYFEP
jgi:predicted LPLAT superfamily acyltransferase